MAKAWLLTEGEPDVARRLAAELGVHPVVGELLVRRGIRAKADGQRYLSRRLSDLHDPATHPGVPEAAERLHSAVANGRKICVYSDYDVDGMCGAAMLLECLRLAGAAPRLYVPDRIEEGYGLNCEALTRLKEDGVDLVVTVDCGIVSAEEARHARAIGLELIITDHHEFGAELPPADVLVHPRLPGGEYPFAGLCGAGVAFKLAWELGRKISGQRRTTEAFQRFLLEATALAAIATVCDMVPLAGENRVLVHHGLASLHAAPPLGLAALLARAGLAEKSKFDVSDIGFAIGPRLNACGRLGQARLGVELLTTKDERKARELAEYFEEENKRRQSLERRIYSEAREQAEARYDWTDPAAVSAIVLASDSWHPGVIGVVASRMVERFHRPCVLVAMGESEGAGSGRSVPGLHLQETLESCRDLLRSSGGHAMAAGIRVDRDRFEDFRERFEAEVALRTRDDPRAPLVRVDVELPLHALTPAMVRALDVLAPFGMDNPAPLFLATNLRVVGEPRKMGGGDRHLSFQVAQGDQRMRAVAFGQAERVAELLADEGRCCLVFSPQINEFHGFPKVELLVKDFRPGCTILDHVEAPCPPPSN